MIREPSFPGGRSDLVTVQMALTGVLNDGPLATASTGEALRRMPPGSSNSGGKYLSHSFGVNRPAYDRPCPTLVKESRRMAHPDGMRWMSIAGAKRIGSFPDQHQFAGKYDDAWNRIGNSVPPLLMRAIARHVRGLLPKQPGESDT